MLLLACSAGYVMGIHYLSRGLEPLFVAILLGVTASAGWCLWEDPGAGGPAMPGRGEGRGGGPDGDPDGNAAVTAGWGRRGWRPAGRRPGRDGPGDPRTPSGAQVREKVPADVE